MTGVWKANVLDAPHPARELPSTAPERQRNSQRNLIERRTIYSDALAKTRCS
jgi:hypothetical protein